MPRKFYNAMKFILNNSICFIYYIRMPNISNIASIWFLFCKPCLLSKKRNNPVGKREWIPRLKQEISCKRVRTVCVVLEVEVSREIQNIIFRIIFDINIFMFRYLSLYNTNKHTIEFKNIVKINLIIILII